MSLYHPIYGIDLGALCINGAARDCAYRGGHPRDRVFPPDATRWTRFDLGREAALKIRGRDVGSSSAGPTQQDMNNYLPRRARGSRPATMRHPHSRVQPVGYTDSLADVVCWRLLAQLG